MEDVAEMISEATEMLLRLAMALESAGLTLTADEEQAVVVSEEEVAVRRRARIDRRPNTARQGYRWTDQEKAQAVRLHDMGMSYAEIAELLHRTKHGVENRLFHHEHGLIKQRDRAAAAAL